MDSFSGSLQKKSKLLILFSTKNDNLSNYMQIGDIHYTIDGRRFTYNSNFFYYFSEIIYECVILKMGTSSKFRAMSSVPLKSNTTNKGTFSSATCGFRSSMVEVVGAHEYMKSRREFFANGPLCALWATSKFLWEKNFLVEFHWFFNVILSFFIFYDIFWYIDIF